MRWIKNNDFTEITCSVCGFTLETNPLVSRKKAFGFPCPNCQEIGELQKMVDKLLNLAHQIPLSHLEHLMTNMRADYLLDGVSRLVNIVRLERLGNDNSVQMEIEGEINSFIRYISMDDMRKISKYLHKVLREL